MCTEECIPIPDNLLMVIFHMGELASIEARDSSHNPYKYDRLLSRIWHHAFSGKPIESLLCGLSWETSSDWVILEIAEQTILFDTACSTVTALPSAIGNLGSDSTAPTGQNSLIHSLRPTNVMDQGLALEALPGAATMVNDIAVVLEDPM